MKELLLSNEFDDLPNILRIDSEHKALLLESFQEPTQTSMQENEQRIVELSEAISPRECWAIDYQGPDIWRTTGVVPIGNASVVARTDNNDTLIERVFQYEDLNGPRGVLRDMASRRSRCTGFSVTNSLGTFPRTTVDRTSELGLPDTLAFSNDLDQWFVYSVTDTYLMTFFIQKGSTIDAPALITAAVNKVRAGAAQ